MNEMELQTTLDPIEMDMGDPVIEYSPVYPNPEGDPTDDLTKVQIQGNIYKVKDPEVHDWARAEEKPTYTKDEVGLGNVDNTSDMDKPVSTATQTALDNKVDKVAGKGLSTNDFTNDFKTKLEGIEAGAEVNTVNSVAGKTGNVTLNKSDVGLGNVDNTSDMNKPVSTATQTALNGKVDNSTLNNYYTKTQTDSALSLKADSSSVYTKTEADNLLNGKVDKVEGKDLSENDFTDTLKSKLDGIEAEANKTVVDNSVTATSTNPVESKAIYNLLNDLLPEATETGNPISISNASGLNAKSLKVELEPIQDLHGYDSPWVGGAGKNKIEPKMASHSYNGISCTNNGDGSFTLNGTASSNATFRIDQSTYAGSDNLKTYTAGSYTVSGLSDGIRLIIMQYSTWSVFATFTTNGTQIASADKNNCFIYLLVPNETSLNNVKIYPQLESGSTASAWQPYSNICPISGRTQTEIKRCGKNLWDEDYTGASSTIIYRPIYVGNTDVTLKTTAPTSTTAGGALLFLLAGIQTSGASTQTNGVYGSLSRTVTSENGYVTVAFRKASDANPADYKTQLEVGSTATTYEPYVTPVDTTIQFGETVYGGTCDVVNGGTSDEWGLHSTFERVSIDSSGKLWKIAEISDVIDYNNSPKSPYILNNMFENKSLVNARLSETPCICHYRKNILIGGYIGNETALDSLLPNLRVCYTLATPTTINTPATSISLNKGNNTLTADGDMELIYSKIPQ